MQTDTLDNKNRTHGKYARSLNNSYRKKSYKGQHEKINTFLSAFREGNLLTITLRGRRSAECTSLTRETFANIPTRLEKESETQAASEILF